MKYKLFAIIVIVVISFSFFSTLVSAKHMGGPLTKEEVVRAAIIFGKDEDAIKKRCAENYPGASPQKMQECIDMYKNGFCWWITGERNLYKNLRGDERDEGAYKECLREALKIEIEIVETGTRAVQVGMTGVPGPGVVGGAGTQIIKTVIQGAQTAKDVVNQAEEMEEERIEKEKLDKTSAINSLNQKLINQKIPSLVTSAIPSLKNGKINLWILSDSAKMKHPTQLPSTDIVKNFPIGTSDGQIVIIGQLAWGEDEKPLNILVYQRTINAILESRTQDEVVNIVMSALREGNIKFTAYSLVGTLAQKATIIYSKFTPSTFDVKRGKTKTVYANGKEATLGKNPLGQGIVSVRDSSVVYRVSRSGETLGYSSKNIQQLIAQDPTYFKRQWGQRLIDDAGYYTGITTPITTITPPTIITEKQDTIITEKQDLWRVEGTYACTRGFDKCVKQVGTELLPNVKPPIEEPVFEWTKIKPPDPVTISSRCETSCSLASLDAKAEASAKCYELTDKICKSIGFDGIAAAPFGHEVTPLGEEKCVPC